MRPPGRALTRAAMKVTQDVAFAPDHGGIRTWSVAHRAPRPRLRRCPRLRRVGRPSRCIAACVGPDHTRHPQLPRYRCTYVRDGAQGSLALRSAPLDRVSLQFSPSVAAQCGLAAAQQSSVQTASISSNFLTQNPSVTQHPAGFRSEIFFVGLGRIVTAFTKFGDSTQGCGRCQVCDSVACPRYHMTLGPLRARQRSDSNGP